MRWSITILLAVAIVAIGMHSCRKSSQKVVVPTPTPVPDTFDTYDMAGMHNWVGTVKYHKDLHSPEDSIVAASYTFPIIVIDSKLIKARFDIDTSKEDILYNHWSNDSELIFYVNKDFTHGDDSIDQCTIYHNFKTNGIRYHKIFGSVWDFKSMTLYATD